MTATAKKPAAAKSIVPEAVTKQVVTLPKKRVQDKLGTAKADAEAEATKPAAKKPAAKKPAAKAKAPAKPKTPAKKPAAKTTAKPAPAAPAAPVEASIPLDDIAPSPLNPRKTFDADGLAELAASIQEKGLLQNIGVRKVSNKKPHYHIVYGERRWKAMQLLVERGAWKANAPVPVKVQTGSDADHLETAILENQARDDVHPLEQAIAVAKLVELRKAESDDPEKATAVIAERIGTTRRNVQVNLQLVANLTDETKQAWEDGEIPSRKIAIELARQPAKLQQEALWALRDLEIGTLTDLRNWIKNGGYNPADALFTEAEYIAAGGEITDIDRPDKTVERLMANRELFSDLQGKAAMARAEEISKAHGLTAPVQEGSWHSRLHGGQLVSAPYDEKAEPKTMPEGAYVRFAMGPSTGAAWFGIIAPETTKAAAGGQSGATKAAPAKGKAAKADAAPAEAPDDKVQPYARRNWMAGAWARSLAMRDVVSYSPQAAVALGLLAALPGDRDWLSATLLDMNPPNRSGDAGKLERELPKLADRALRGLKGFDGASVADRGTALRTLLAMPMDKLLALYAQVIGAQLVDMPTQSADAGSSKEAIALAEYAEANRKKQPSLGVALDAREDLATQEWFGDYTAAQLKAMLVPTGVALRAKEGEPVPSHKAGLAEFMGERVAKGWIPPEAEFLPRAEMETAVAKLLQGQA